MNPDPSQRIALGLLVRAVCEFQTATHLTLLVMPNMQQVMINNVDSVDVRKHINGKKNSNSSTAVDRLL
jgi:hypothetical protein